MTAFENLGNGINNVVGPMINTPTVTSSNSSSQLPTNTNNQNQSSATGTNNQNTSSTVNVNYNVNVTANGNNVNTDMVKQAVAEAITNEKTVSAIRDGFEKLYPKKGQPA
jgi:biopolymer transport protein ExbD